MLDLLWRDFHIQGADVFLQVLDALSAGDRKNIVPLS